MSPVYLDGFYKMILQLGHTNEKDPGWSTAIRSALWVDLLKWLQQEDGGTWARAEAK